MALIEIPLNNLRYRFRKLTWREEIRLAKNSDPKEDYRHVYLTAALTEVAGEDGRKLTIQSSKDSVQVLTAIPQPILHRLWVLYKASLPDNQYFSTKGLYSAPEPRVFERIVEAASENNEEQGLKTIREAERKFGARDIAENHEVERAILEDAKKRGVLRSVKEGDV